MPNLLVLQDLYTETLVRELLAKVKDGALNWVNIGTNQFQATAVQHSACTDPSTPDITWDYFITKTQVTSLSYTYNLVVQMNSVTQVAVTNGPLLYTDRDSDTKALYDTVELLVMGLDVMVKQAVNFVQTL